MRNGTVIVHLHSGAQIDISTLTPDEAVAELQRRGVSLADIAQTVHYIERAEIERAARA
jgi:hypothetical protein